MTRYYVTERDIREGKRGDGTRCPVVRAIQRRHPGKHISVWQAIWIGRTSYRAPPKVTAFITALDRGDSGAAVRPFRFTL